MPYADKEKQREYQRLWMQRRRLDWIESQGGACRNCGSTEDLEVDHIDRATKVTHRVWSWSESKRMEELKKCQVLCSVCHKGKSIEAMAKPLVHGTFNGYTEKKCRCDECRTYTVARVSEARRIRKQKQRSGLV